MRLTSRQVEPKRKGMKKSIVTELQEIIEKEQFSSEDEFIWEQEI